LVDTCGIEQDELYKKSIATEIEKHIGSVCAVLILVDVNTRATDYALSALSAILPKTLANNIALMRTKILIPFPLNWNVFKGYLPEGLKDPPQFLFDNPIAIQKSQKGNPIIKDQLQSTLCKAALASEQKALEMLVNFFDWLYGLEPQPTKDFVNLYEMSQAINASSPCIVALDTAATRKAEIDKLVIMLKKNLAVRFPPCLHLALESYARWTQDMDAFSNSDKTVNIPIRKQQSTTTHKIHNKVLVDEDIKKKWDEAKDGKETTAALIAVNEMVLHDLNQVIACVTNNLVPLAERYARLSLAGSCSAQVRSAVRFLEEQYHHMEVMRGRIAQEKVKESLDHMKWKLELLNKVEKHREECRNSK
jgi:hypothetical protein